MPERRRHARRSPDRTAMRPRLKPLNRLGGRWGRLPSLTDRAYEGNGIRQLRSRGSDRWLLRPGSGFTLGHMTGDVRTAQRNRTTVPVAEGISRIFSRFRKPDVAFLGFIVPAPPPGDVTVICGPARPICDLAFPNIQSPDEPVSGSATVSGTAAGTPAGGTAFTRHEFATPPSGCSRRSRDCEWEAASSCPRGLRRPVGFRLRRAGWGGCFSLPGRHL